MKCGNNKKKISEKQKHTKKYSINYKLKEKKTSNEGAKMQDLMTYVAIKHIYKTKKMKN